MSEPLAITCVINSLAAGGAERSMAWLSTGLVARGYNVTLMTVEPLGKDFFGLDAGVRRVVAPLAVRSSCRWFDLLSQRRRRSALCQALLATQPQVVVSFTDTLNVQVLNALWGKSLPVIVSERTNPQKHDIGWRWRMLRRIIYPWAARVVVQTEATAQWARHQVPRWKTTVIPNAVPLSPPAMIYRPDWFGRFNLIAMGRLGLEKGYTELIQAFAVLAEQHPDWHLTILGEGNERPVLEALVIELGLNGRVHLPGRISEPWTILRAADIYVLTSHYEGFPNALAEAMACGLPVVAVDCPTGPAEIIRHEVDGLLVPQHSQVALVSALNCLMGDELLRKEFSDRAPEICERFSESFVLDRWCALINEVAGR